MSTLLLCDDHRVVRQALADLLGSVAGVSQVEQAGSGEEVLALYPKLLPDAVLMDVRLPRMDGVTATAELLQAYPDARVLLLAGEIREDDRRRGLRAGAPRLPEQGHRRPGAHGGFVGGAGRRRPALAHAAPRPRARTPRVEPVGA